MTIIQEEPKEFAFVLGLPLVFSRRTVGSVVKEFTNIGLNVIGLRCMSVTNKFMRAYLQKKDKDTFTDLVREFVNTGPYVAMKLEGDEAVSKACALVSAKQEHPFWDNWPLICCSKSFESAKEDAAMWFCIDSPKWQREESERKNLIFALPNGKICGGPTEKASKDIVDSIKIDFCLDRQFQRFILIRPKAFHNGMMPELLCTIEDNCFFMKGLKLVKKSEVPLSVAWSDSSSCLGETEKEEFGIACIVLSASIQFNEEDILFGSERVNREFVFVSEEVDTLKFVEEFFQFGVVGWLTPKGTEFCGGIFEPTLTGLLF